MTLQLSPQGGEEMDFREHHVHVQCFAHQMPELAQGARAGGAFFESKMYGGRSCRKVLLRNSLRKWVQLPRTSIVFCRP
jgi:hypothetical protein